MFDEIKTGLTEAIEYEKETRKKYLILAGKDKLEQQLYLTGYKDCDEWTISIVPRPMSKTKALKLIKRVEKELVGIRKKFPRKYPQDMSFELQEYNDAYENDMKE